MVFYFTSNVVEPPAIIYMGKDKFENEELIKHAWDSDVWFHVDKLSSAHVYLRLQPCKVNPAASSSPAGTPPTARSTKGAVKTLPKPMTGASASASAAVDNHLYCTRWDDIPDVLLQELAQLTKANSIEGNKKDNLSIIYTPASNLLKTGDMATGAVSFHQPKQVKRVHIATRVNDIVNRLNKTKVERHPDLAQEKLEYEKARRAELRQAEKIKREEEERLKREYKEKKAASSYDNLFDPDAMTTNKDMEAEDDDDFFM
ncbi:hypothetical protein BCR44DRAFT_1429493 [Catenaria anguillulae PL171]|uniref:NFACT RNA-binding domain-containing protein n=1 Tax=Catenaria anguillulae PL171 TaxID=765915 RepID=A0A1Y2HWH7_9FUNG|nr:hypothetical protein BCR44DRAFT_1429493 [Catenaria anguillulae PL171]